MKMTFRSQSNLGFGIPLILALAISILSFYSTRYVSISKDEVINNYALDLAEIEKLRVASEKSIASSRGYLFTLDKTYLDRLSTARNDFLSSLQELRVHANSRESSFLFSIEKADREHYRSLLAALEKRRNQTNLQETINFFDSVVQPKRNELELRLGLYSEDRKQRFFQARENSIQASTRANFLILLISAIAIVSGLIAAIAFSRTLNSLYDETKKAVNIREKVVGIVAHDLKNPISSILLAAELLEGECKVSDNECFKIIRRSAQKMQNLVSDILSLEKVRAGSLSVVCNDVDMLALIKETAFEFVVAAREKRLTIELTLPESFSDRIRFDKARLSQVISNFLSNAIKFSPVGSRIVIEYKENDLGAIVSVRDFGRGIPAKDQKHLFNQYWQAPETAQLGTGLGLSIAKGIVEAHSGVISVESKLGEGTTFRFFVPRRGADLSESDLEKLSTRLGYIT